MIPYGIGERKGKKGRPHPPLTGTAAYTGRQTGVFVNQGRFSAKLADNRSTETITASRRTAKAVRRSRKWRAA